MKLQKIFAPLCLILILCHYTLSMGMNPTNQNIPMSDQEIEALFNEFWQGIDQETLNELAKIGEEIIKEAEAKGMDPFDYIMQESEAQAPTPPPAPVIPLPQPTQKSPVIINTSKTAQAKEFLKALEQVIPSIRQKASMDIVTNQMIDPYFYDLNDLMYYLGILLRNNHLIQYLADQEFSKLFELLNQSSQTLVDFDNQLQVSEFNLKGKTPYTILQISPTATQDQIIQAYQKKYTFYDPTAVKKRVAASGASKEEQAIQEKKAEKKRAQLNNAYNQLRNEQQAHFITQNIAQEFNNIFNTNNIIASIKTLVAKHEPEIVKAKQEREKEEEEARQSYKRSQELAAAMPKLYFDMPAPFNYDFAAPSNFTFPSFNPPFTPDYSASSAPVSTGLPSLAAPDKGGDQKGGKPGAKDDKKKDGKENKGQDKDKDKTRATKEKISTKTQIKVAGLKKDLESAIKNMVKKIEATENKQAFTMFAEHTTKKYDPSQKEVVNSYLNLFSTLQKDLTAISEDVKKAQEDFKKDKDPKGLAEYNKEVASLINKFEKTATTSGLKGNIVTPMQNLANKATSPFQAMHPNKRFVYLGDSTVAPLKNKDLQELNKADEKTGEYTKPLTELVNAYTKFINLKNPKPIPGQKAPAPAPKAESSAKE